MVWKIELVAGSEGHHYRIFNAFDRWIGTVTYINDKKKVMVGWMPEHRHFEEEFLVGSHRKQDIELVMEYAFGYVRGIERCKAADWGTND